MALKTAQYTWIFFDNRCHAYKTLWAPPEFSIWSCWLQRHFERPQVFHLNTEVIIKQSFGVLWWWW